MLRTNVAKIDRLKGEGDGVRLRRQRGLWGRSRGFRYDWLLPTAPVFPESVRDDIMGYRLADKRSMSGDLEGGDEEASFDHPPKEDFRSRRATAAEAPERRHWDTRTSRHRRQNRRRQPAPPGRGRGARDDGRWG